MRQDISFRSELAQLYRVYEQFLGSTVQPSDGALLIADVRVERLRTQYPPSVLNAYTAAQHAISRALQMPIRSAGPRGQEWSTFDRPTLTHTLPAAVVRVPGMLRADRCLLVDGALWTVFRDVSLWVEVLCVHEWSLFAKRVTQGAMRVVDCGEAYTLLTAHPASRRPLTWERSHSEVLLLEGKTFTCPWTERCITQGTPFDVDHLLPLAVYLMNELWNFVPADPVFNQCIKRNRLPSLERLQKAELHLTNTYTLYAASLPLSTALTNDTALRFGGLLPTTAAFPQQIARAVIQLIDTVAIYRNLVRF